MTKKESLENIIYELTEIIEMQDIALTEKRDVYNLLEAYEEELAEEQEKELQIEFKKRLEETNV